MNMRSALTNKNIAGQDELTIGTLDAQTLAFAVTTVAGGAHTFFMSKELKIHFQHVVVLRSHFTIR